MGKVAIRNITKSDDTISEISIESILKAVRVFHRSDSYFLYLGSTEIEISRDVLLNLLEDLILMLDYDDRQELLSRMVE